jgi:hypothetical protein
MGPTSINTPPTTIGFRRCPPPSEDLGLPLTTLKPWKCEAAICGRSLHHTYPCQRCLPGGGVVTVGCKKEIPFVGVRLLLRVAHNVSSH